MIVLEASQITKIYGGRKNISETLALNGIDFKIRKGEFTAIMGPSGSGKTTLLNVLSMISKPTSGSIEFLGENLDDLKKDNIAKIRRKNMGFIFQDFNLMDSLTLKENVLLPMILEKKSLEYMEKTCDEIMKITGIDDLVDKYPYNVSGGEQQRTAIARALVNEPDIIFADEPTGNLDSKSSDIIMSCFQNINEKRNSTILMVTHDVFAASFCKKVVFIKDGSIHSVIVKKGTNKGFMQEILDFMAVNGGGSSEI